MNRTHDRSTWSVAFAATLLLLLSLVMVACGGGAANALSESDRISLDAFPDGIGRGFASFQLACR